MPLVFVHGVNVRQGTTDKEIAGFAEVVRRRDELFRNVGLAGLVARPSDLYVENPYWGDLGARFRYDLASVPRKGAERFGTAGELMERVLQETLPQSAAAALAASSLVTETFLLTLARNDSLITAVDALVTASLLDVPDDWDGVVVPNGDLAMFAAQALQYVDSGADLSWLRNPKTDDEFVERLLEEVDNARTMTSVESFGGVRLSEQLKRAARRLGQVATTAVRATVDAAKGVVRGTVGAVVGGVGGVVGGAAFAAVPGVLATAARPIATQRAGQFLGDVFAYLANREPIQKIVIDALQSADRKRTSSDSRLVVVAHSMGGNIVYDLLTSSLADKLEVDALVTVGSQVGLFKELALFSEDLGASLNAPTSASGHAKVPKPGKVRVWINVFDPIDVLGFAAAGVFEDVDDFAFSNETSPLDAHSMYFFRPRFHQRLRVRLAEAGLGKTV